MLWGFRLCASPCAMQMTDQAAAKIDAEVQVRWKKTTESGGAEALDRFLAYFGSQPAAAPALALPGFEAGARGTYWYPKVSGTVESTAGGLAGTSFDVETDLGIEKKGAPGGPTLPFAAGPVAHGPATSSW